MIMPSFKFDPKNIPQVLFGLLLVLFSGGVGGFAVYLNVSDSILKPGSEIELRFEPINPPKDTLKEVQIYSAPMVGTYTMEVVKIIKDADKKVETLSE